VREPGLVRGRCMVKGFISGSFFMASIISGYGFIPQLLLFAAALFIFIESIMLFGQNVYIVTTVLFNLVGIAVTFFMQGILSLYIVLIILITAAVYAIK